MRGFLTGLLAYASGSPLVATYGVGNGSSGFVFDNSGNVITAPSSIYAWAPNSASRVVLTPTTSLCAAQVALTVKLAADFDSQLSRSDGNTIEWTFL